MHSALAKLNLETDTGMPNSSPDITIMQRLLCEMTIAFVWLQLCLLTARNLAVVALDVLTPLLPAADILNEMIKAIRKVCLYPLLCLLSPTL